MRSWLEISARSPTSKSALSAGTCANIGTGSRVGTSSVNSVSVAVLSRFITFLLCSPAYHRRAAPLAHDQALAHDQQASVPARMAPQRALLDHLVRAHQNRWGYRKPE